MTSILAAGSNRYFKFDSASRMVCADTAPGGCALNRVHYDVDGRRVLDDDPTAMRFVAFVADSVSVDGGLANETRIEIWAFGERVAYKRSGDDFRTAGGLGGVPWRLPPAALGLFAGLGLLALLAWSAKHGALILVIQRPGYAGVSAVLVVALVLGPVPGVRVSRAGGGGDASFSWELTDPLGTGMVMLDETGARQLHRTYSPFGVEHASAGTAGWLPRHFAGHLEDADSGLLYMQARWMDPQSGTFLSVDPVVADSGDPQAFNAYAYARNNPLNFTDPTGQLWAELGSWLSGPGFGSGMSIPETFSFWDPYGGIHWTTYQDGRLIDVVAANFVAGQAHAIWAMFSGLGSAPALTQTAKFTLRSEKNPVVDNDSEAWAHYREGQGEPAELGPESQAAIKNSSDQRYRAERIRTGKTSDINRGNYGVDVTREKFFIGDTPVHYETLCRSGTCTTTFTSKGDGFWDVMYDVDRAGPKGELPGGHPYPFLPFSWEMIFTDPRPRE